MGTSLILSICIAANIGGTGMLTGTPINLVMVGQLPDFFGYDAAIDYITWLFAALPLMCICLITAWLTLIVFFLRNPPKKSKRVSELLKKKYNDLPRMRLISPVFFVLFRFRNEIFHISHSEKMVTICFFVLLFLWVFKEPGFMPGYGRLFPKGYFSDTTSVMMVALVLYVLPSESVGLCDYKQNEVPRLLDWPMTSSRVSWNVVLILGGGFALAAGVNESGLSSLVGKALSVFGHFPLWIFQVITMCFTMVITNFVSNLATTMMVIPIVATLPTRGPYICGGSDGISSECAFFQIL
ncbi:hypothetical protein DICVIV_13199 [Dictyocaulus viviparus]|uniref:Sodium:sulfate symporter transmembrane region n=1 Tax=Dictyocaulus viviparus TaxID=29172 RepID=A0A0D8XAQ0_DICVI|nr:hypothetical protein DICVIV_13199 [Dictyocaulus viviparus]